MRNHRLHALALVLICAMLSLPSKGAGNAEWHARVWQSDDGLPDNNVTGVGQTSDGYLWVATQGGLAQFDGQQFKRFPLPFVAGSSLEMIRAARVCNGDRLWLALEGGAVMMLSPDETQLYTANDGLWIFRPSSIAQDSDGAMWVGYWDGSACRIAGGKAQRFSEKEGLPSTGICLLETDVHKQLWFTQGGRVGVYRHQHFESLITIPEHPACIGARHDGGMWICAGKQLYRFEEGGALQKCGELGADGESVEPLTLFEDRTGAVWVGTAASGLFRFDGTNISRVESSRGEIRCVTEDQEGNIWVGTSGGGLDRLRPRLLQLFGVEHGLPFETVRSVCEGTNGTLWVVTQNGLLARSRGQAWSLVGTNEGWTRSQASCITGDEQGNVWIGTTGGGLRKWSDGTFTAFHPRDGLVSDRIWTVMADSQSNVWMASDRPNSVQRMRGTEFEKFDLPPGSRVVRAMAEDKNHVIWLGTEDGRLLRIRDHHLEEEPQPGLARPAPIRCLSTTPDGTLWIAYGGAGVGWLKEKKFARIGAEEGLPDDFVSQVVADNQGALWFASNRGVFAVKQNDLERVAGGELEDVRPMLYGRNEGVPSLQANFGYGLAAVRTRDGRICFSMLTGLLVVYPARVGDNSNAPPGRVERVSVDGKETEARQFGRSASKPLPSLDLSPRMRELKLDYNGLSFAAPESVRFRYKMDGYDQNPIETTARSVTYSGLAAGSYLFHVTACNDAGVWNPAGDALAILIEPLFWQTWWFRLAAVVVVIGSTIALARLIFLRRLRQRLVRLEQESAVEKDRARIAKDLHDDLGAHLSHIAMLSELAQSDFDRPNQARDHLDQIFRTARLLTRSLDEIVWSVNPRNDRLDRFAAHICQFAPEFLRAAGIRCRLDLPLDLPPVELPANVRHQVYLGVKEALHNIVKHARASEVWLRLAITANSLTLSIEDNGRGFDTTAAARSGEDGLINLRHRMTEIGGRLEQTSDPVSGTRVIFIAPIDGGRL